MRSPATTVFVIAGIFALFHIIFVGVPVALSGGSGEGQAFVTAIFDLPIFWLLESFPGSRAVLYGSSPSIYMLVFGVGGTFMYATVGALLGWAIDAARRGH
jgi:ABC-type Na+ efflux pump permease subunit